MGAGDWPKSDHKKGGCVNLVLTKGGIKNPNNVVDIICELPLRAKIVFRPRDRLSGGVENRERVGVFPGPVFTSLSWIISEGLFLLIFGYWYFSEKMQKFIIQVSSI